MPDRSAPARLRVLVVDDNEATVESLFLIFTHWGHDVRVARDGEQALDVAPAFRPQVILLDLGLPGIDGFVVARRLRDDSRFDQTAVLGITGSLCDDAMARDAGFDRVLLKPLEIGRFAAEFRRIAARRPESGARTVEATGQGVDQPSST